MKMQSEVLSSLRHRKLVSCSARQGPEQEQRPNHPTGGPSIGYLVVWARMSPPGGEPGGIERRPARAASVRADNCSLQITAPLWQTRQVSPTLMITYNIDHFARIQASPINTKTHGHTFVHTCNHTEYQALTRLNQAITAMSSHRILITGASGYLGGTLLARLKGAGLAGYDKLYALVRTDAQAEAVRQYGAEPLAFDARDEAAVRTAVVDHKITIVYYLIDPIRSEAQVNFIKALAEVKRVTGQEVHLLHVSGEEPLAISVMFHVTRLTRSCRQTTGAKIFSSHAGAPTDAPLLDTDPTLYSVQKAQVETAPFDIFKTVSESKP